jgi:2-succinyl-5-enolpyruvyl-6-hydroxy-3-cyclohexene-1-carboxylate synthase
MNTFYTNEKHTQILIALMKKHGIKKIIASPGATNICLVASLQNDPYFEIYSSVDERSAAYMACGLAAESGEPVVLSCTGATASRNYMPGLTEAFYRKLPILAVTSTQRIDRIGHNIPQVIDRSVEPNDIFNLSVYIPEIYNDEDKWSCEVRINEAILGLTHHGGGPVHINLVTNYSPIYDVEELPDVRVIKRIYYNSKMPEISKGRLGIYVGAHKEWSRKLTDIVDKFCCLYNAVVFCDHTSNYKGKYRVFPSLVVSQDCYTAKCCSVDLLLHIGDISGSYVTILSKKTWRINCDGKICDTFKNLQYVFEMNEEDFFEKYVELAYLSTNKQENTFLLEWQNEYKNIYDNIPEIPFSNPWIAKNTIGHIPENSVLHLGILNTLRSWNYFEISNNIKGYSNTGGFGIDGNTSSLIGASLADSNRLFFGVVGDLSFFYDMNSLGNHHIGNNLRLMIINNGKGAEFTMYNHLGAKFKEKTNDYIAAANHYGKKSAVLIKHYAEDLGFEYISAKNKEEYLNNLERFTNPNILEKSIVFEVFTDSKDESEAHRIIRNIRVSKKGIVKKMVKNTLGEKGVILLKNFIKK